MPSVKPRKNKGTTNRPFTIRFNADTGRYDLIRLNADEQVDEAGNVDQGEFYGDYATEGDAAKAMAWIIEDLGREAKEKVNGRKDD